MVWKNAAAREQPQEIKSDLERGVDSGVFRKPELTPAQEKQTTWGQAASTAELTRLTERAARNVKLSELSLRTVQRLCDLEAPDGLYAFVAGVSPRLCARVEALREGHFGLRTLARALFRFVQTDAPSAMVHMTLLRLNDAVRCHEEAVASVLQDALLIDLGGEEG